VSQLVRSTLGWPEHRNWSQRLADTKCRAFFGDPANIIADIWNAIESDLLEAAAQPKNLLWGLLFMKVYAIEEVHCRIIVVGWPDPQTFRRQWGCYIILEKIVDLEPRFIIWDNRFNNGFKKKGKVTCLASVDGTDCSCRPVMEPSLGLSQRSAGIQRS